MSAEDLAREVRARRAALGLTQADVRDAGGPSTETSRLIEGAQQADCTPLTLAKLDRALQWADGSAAALLQDGASPQKVTAAQQADLDARALAVELYRAGLLTTLDTTVERRVGECLARAAGGAS